MLFWSNNKFHDYRFVVANSLCLCAFLASLIFCNASNSIGKLGDFKQSSSQESDIAVAATKRLRAAGVDPTMEGIKTYLRLLRPTEPDKKALDEIIEKLGAPEYRIRQFATKQLVTSIEFSNELIQQRSQSYGNRPEVSYRISKVLNARKDNPAQAIQDHLLNLIEQKGMKLSSELLDAYPFLVNDEFLRRKAGRLIGELAIPENVPKLASVLDEKEIDGLLKSECVKALSRLKPVIALKVAKANLDATDEFGLSVAKVLVEQGDRAALEILQALSVSDRPTFTSGTAQRVLLGMMEADLADFRGMQWKKRSQVITQRFKTFVEKNEDFVIEWNPVAIRVGRRLLSHYSKGELWEVDDEGTILWKATDLDHPFATCVGVDNERYAASYRSGDIYVFNESGKKIRTIKSSTNISSMCPLANGNIMVASGQGDGTIAEIRPDGEVVKSFKLKHTPTGVSVMNDGNYLVAHYSENFLATYSREGQLIRKINVGNAPYFARELESGNFLVCFTKTGTLKEFSPDGKLVWSHDTDSNIYHAQQRVDGRYEFADKKGFHLVDRKGNRDKPSAVKAITTINYLYSF